MSSARSSVLATGGTLAQGIRIAKGQPDACAQAIVCLEELAGVADVVPLVEPVQLFRISVLVGGVHLGAAHPGIPHGVRLESIHRRPDVPERLASYLAVFDPTFIGGTGADAQLSEVRKQYGVTAERRAYGNDYVYVHSSFIYLIDRKGLLRALMPYGHSPEDFSHDLTILLKE
jgi:hypothetical protein